MQKYRYIVQLSLEDGILFHEGLKTKGNLFKHFRLYHSHGYEYRCWSCGMVANAFIGRELWNGEKLEREDMILCHVDSNGKVYPFSRDHIVPACFDGPNKQSNYRPACEHCNTSRMSRMTPDEVLFAQREFGLLKVSGLDLERLVHLVSRHQYRKTPLNPVVRINLPWQEVYAKIMQGNKQVTP